MNANPNGPLRRMQMAARAFDASDNVIIVLEAADNEPGLRIPGLRILGVNGAFCRVFDITEDAAVGRALISLAAEPDDPVLTEAVAGAVAARQSLRTEIRCRTGGGGVFWFGLHLMASPDPVTGECHFVVLGRDITDRKAAGARQDVVQHLLARVFLCVDAAVVITSDNGQILMNNPHFEQLFGHPPGSLVGRSTNDLIAPQVLEATEHQRRQPLAAGEDYRVDSVGLHRDGSEVPVQITSVVANVKGAERFRIVTARKRAGADGPQCRVGGIIKLLGLDEVRSALGARWPEMEQRAMQTAEHVIRRSLGPGETFAPSTDGGFVICFADRTEEEASFVAAIIGRRIREHLVGQDEEMAPLQVTAIAGAVDLPAEANATVDLAGLLEHRLSARRVEIEAKARRMLAEALTETRCVMLPVFHGDRDRLVAHVATIPKPAYRKLVTAHGGLPAAEQARFDLESILLNLAIDRVQQGLLTDPVALVFIDVHFQVFQRRAATQSYLEACRALNPVLRRRLILTLRHFPENMSNNRLQQCVQALRPFCRRVAFAIDEPRLEPTDPVLEQAPIVAINAALVSGPGSGDKLGRLVATIHHRRGRLLVRDVPDAPTAATLRRAGVDLVARVE